LNGGKRKAAAIPKSTDPEAKKAKLVEIVDKEEKPLTKKEKKAKQQAEKKEKKEKTDKTEKTEEKVEKAEKKEKKEAKADNVKTLPSGLVVEDVAKGTGPVAKNGKKVSVRYIGKLTNGKVFDSNTKGAPFNFKLGKGEVIKGWDMGIAGMNVGGTRVLTIPANLAYGSKGAPPEIPPNATLKFEVKLLQVKN
jgi:FK506-binding nuclear protein